MNQISVTVGLSILFFAGGLKIILASSHSKIRAEQFQEFNLSTVEIIEKYGYPAETHTTESVDGYILTMHRIPHGKNSPKTRYPILLQHGLLADSSEFVVFGANSAAFILSDAGYDIWLGNTRGNHYTRTHRKLSTEDKQFWDFSWHEGGVYDLPAQIDYILNYTKYDKILFLGYSMGTTQYFAMASERPEYQKKIRAALLLAPVAYVKHVRTPLKIFAPGANGLQGLFEAFTHGEFSLQSPGYLKFISKFCNSTSLQPRVCENLIFSIAGYDHEEFNERALQNVIGHLPSSTSTKSLAHYGQLVNSGKFRQYDYGRIKNLAKYKQSSPPDYNLEAIKTPLALFVGQNDNFVQPRDFMSLLKRLSCVKTIDVVPYRRFTHLDFIAAKHAKQLLYDTVVERIKNFLTQQCADI